MGFSVPESGKGGGKGFGQQRKPANNNNNKWKGKKNGKRGIAMGIRRFQPSVPFLVQSGPPAMAFKSMPVVSPFKNHTLASKRRLKRGRKLYSPCAPLAPRNTTSFIMQAKKLGGIGPVVTPPPATPAVLPTPILSPVLRDKGSLEEMNKELGVDGYGSMNGLIRLRSYEDRARDLSESESDVDQVDLLNGDQSVHSAERVEQRIDQGLSRFEMIYPSRASGVGLPKNLEYCVDSQERLIAQLEEENLTLKERLFLVEQEVNELRQRVRELEGLNRTDEPMEEHCEESCGDVSAPCGRT